MQGEHEETGMSHGERIGTHAGNLESCRLHEAWGSKVSEEKRMGT